VRVQTPVIPGIAEVVARGDWRRKSGLSLTTLGLWALALGVGVGFVITALLT
jgi:hypothetical protein